jgi:hypothetical protein
MERAMVTRNVSYMETISKMYFADAANHNFPVNGRAPVGLNLESGFMNASSTCNTVMNVRKVSHLQLKVDYGIDYLCCQESDGLSSVSFCLLGLLKIHEVMEFVPLNV